MISEYRIYPLKANALRGFLYHALSTTLRSFWPGIPGRFAPEGVADLKRNQWPIWCRIVTCHQHHKGSFTSATSVPEPIPLRSDHIRLRLNGLSMLSKPMTSCRGTTSSCRTQTGNWQGLRLLSASVHAVQS